MMDRGYVSFATIVMIMAARSSLEGGLAVLWVQTPELYPTELRSTGHAIGCAMGRLGAFCAIYWIDCVAYEIPIVNAAGTALY